MQRQTRTGIRRGTGEASRPEIRRGTYFVLAAILLATLTLSGCGGRMPEDLGPRDGRLLACPSSPNCVSSFETDAVHGIEALRLNGPPEVAWAALVSDLRARDRVELVRNESNHIHAVFTSALMRYRDDVEFLLLPERGEIAVRSASRVGYGDMGANRNRIESIRHALVEQGVVLPASSD